MPSDQTVLFALLGIVLALLVWGRWRYDFVAFGALVAAVMLGVVPVEKAFEGFGHPATIIIALVLIVSRGLSNAGVVDQLGRLLNAKPRSLPAHIGLMSAIAAPLSAVMNNVAALALLMPLDVQAAAKAKRPPGMTLMALSFATILGGLDSILGAALGGFIIGILENLSDGFFKAYLDLSGVKEVAPYVILVVILMIKPYGLFGTKEIERV